MEVGFTHYWITGSGWTQTMLSKDDFESIDFIGENDEGMIFQGINEAGRKQILLVKK
jgi:hypothetical protein